MSRQIEMNNMCVPLSTNRLMLRPYRQDDAPAMRRMAGEWVVAATTMTMPHPYPKGVAEEWIASHESMFEKKRAIPWAVTLKENSVLIGTITLLDISQENKRAELGYWIGAEYWKQGYCTEAAQALMAYAKDVLGVTRIVGRCFVRNITSARVMEKCGLAHEGTLPQHVARRGTYEDMLLYGLNNAARVEPVEA